MIIPRVTDDIPRWDAEHLPTSTCSKGGVLSGDNSGWRTARPVIASCRGCCQCYLYCPDGAIRMTEGRASVDYGFCKGCGICARICRFGCISMEAER